MTMTGKRMLTTTAILSAAALALSGCGPKSVYDFTQLNGMEPADEIGVEIPDELRQAAGTAAENLLVSSFTARSRALDGSEHCAVDVDISYADNAVDTLTRPEYTEEQAAVDAREGSKSFLDRFEVATAQELEQQMIAEVERHAEESIGGVWGPQSVEGYLRERYDTEEIKVAAAHHLLGLSTEAVSVRDQFESSDARSAASVEKVVRAVNDDIEREHRDRASEAAAVPLWERIADPLGIDDAKPLSGLNETSPEEGAYFSEDLERATLVLDCAKSPTDADSAGSLDFPVASDDGVRRFAGVELVVMESGDLSVAGGDVDGYLVDANGDWISE